MEGLYHRNIGWNNSVDGLLSMLKMCASKKRGLREIATQIVRFRYTLLRLLYYTTEKEEDFGSVTRTTPTL